MEIAVPALPLAFALMLAASSTAQSVEHHEAFHVACAQGRSFGLRIEGRQARVQLADRELLLARRPSSLGQHFRSAEATLIIDDAFVAFVQRGDWDWQDCRIDQP
ncbi:hypothetical protein CAF53_17000 [Sphingobium sp. LB126]|uniref:hypothetical protein n=1 Tax=Sphingobium sp. LB126 TaxID=1983755 RepID=UPI000CB2D756|nr:hypothetical protein [Sphingobium sp. LB126]PJG45935.1 hypothetical protein CAF53_17000 [Sphingobium sp. LB126]